MKRLILAWFCFGLVVSLQGAEAKRAIYLSGNQTLVGCIYKPPGDGPFPAIIFNQAGTMSFSKQERLNPFPELADFYISRGYVLFLPGRHKTGSEVEKPKKGEPKESADDRNKRVMENHRLQVENIVAAVQWLRAQTYVDEKRLVMTGHAMGGISTLLASERGLSMRGFIAFSPGAGSWNYSATLSRRVKSAVKNATVPVFVIQAENEESTAPAKALGYELEKKGKPNAAKIYPPFGLDAKTAYTFALEGTKVWGKDVLAFLDEVLR